MNAPAIAMVGTRRVFSCEGWSSGTVYAIDSLRTSAQTIHHREIAKEHVGFPLCPPGLPFTAHRDHGCGVTARHLRGAAGR